MQMKLFTRHTQAFAAAIAFLVPGELAQFNHIAVIGVDGSRSDGGLNANSPSLEDYKETR